MMAVDLALRDAAGEFFEESPRSFQSGYRRSSVRRRAWADRALTPAPRPPRQNIMPSCT